MKFVRATGTAAVFLFLGAVLLMSAQHTPQQVRAWQEQRGWLKEGAWQGHDTWQEHRAQKWSSDHRTWTQRAGYGGFNIPQDRFNLNFGSEHLFRIRTRPVIYQGFPRFDYGGDSFILVDPRSGERPGG